MGEKQKEQKTKLFRVDLAQMIRFQWSGVVEAPADLSAESVAELLDNHVERDDYEEDHDYYESVTKIAAEVPDEPAEFRIDEKDVVTVVGDESPVNHGTEETCNLAPDKKHKPDWSTAHTEVDGSDGEKDNYLDVQCVYCGRSGCVGRVNSLMKNFSW